MAAKCGTFFITLQDRCSDNYVFHSFPVRCGRWDCPTCRQKKANKHRERINLYFLNEQLFMYTFTFFHNLPPMESWRRASAAWNKLHIRLLHRYGKFPYVRVLESHTESPYPHYHILTNKLLSTQYLGKMALECGFGYQTRVTRVSSAGGGNYVSKYLTKSWAREDSFALRSALHLRIVCYSRGFGHGVSARGRFYFVGISNCQARSVADLRTYQFTILARGGVFIDGCFEGNTPYLICAPPKRRGSIYDFDRRFMSLPDYPEAA